MGTQKIYSNTDWVLTVEGGEEPFVFGASHVWLNEITNKGTQEINARQDIRWTLE